MDNEDRPFDQVTGCWKVPQTARMDAWTGSSHVDGNGNTVLSFCRVDGRKFFPLIPAEAGPQLAYEYAVLKLGTACPNGSIAVTRSYDNEDDNAATRMLSGTLAPGSYIDSNRNAVLSFCLFRNAPSGAPTMVQQPGAPNQFPILGFRYGVFAGSSFAGSAFPKGSILTDDENCNTASRLSYPVNLPLSSVRNVILGYDRNLGYDPVAGDNTTLYTAQVSP